MAVVQQRIAARPRVRVRRISPVPRPREPLEILRWEVVMYAAAMLLAMTMAVGAVFALGGGADPKFEPVGPKAPPAGLAGNAVGR